jgi:hypothetical protein
MGCNIKERSLNLVLRGKESLRACVNLTYKDDSSVTVTVDTTSSEITVWSEVSGEAIFKRTGAAFAYPNYSFAYLFDRESTGIENIDSVFRYSIYMKVSLHFGDGTVEDLGMKRVLFGYITSIERQAL